MVAQDVCSESMPFTNNKKFVREKKMKHKEVKNWRKMISVLFPPTMLK